MARFDVLREIERLDPARDCQRIMHLSFGYEFYRPNRTHESGYEIGALGPPRLVAAERRRAGASAPPGG